METITAIPVQPNNLGQLIDALTQLSDKAAELEVWQKYPDIIQFEISKTQEYDDSDYFWVTSLEDIEFRSEADKRRVLFAANVLEQSEVEQLGDQPYEINECLSEIDEYLGITSYIPRSGTFERPKHLKSLVGQMSVAIRQTLASYEQGQEVFLVKEPVIEFDDEHYYSSGETVVGVHSDRRSAQQHLKAILPGQLDWIQSKSEEIIWNNSELIQQQLAQPNFKQVIQDEAFEFLPSIEAIRLGEEL